MSGKALNNNILQECKKYIVDAEKYGFAKINDNEKKRMADIFYELGICAKRVNANAQVEQCFNKALNFQKKYPPVIFARAKMQFDDIFNTKRKKTERAGRIF